MGFFGDIEDAVSHAAGQVEHAAGQVEDLADKAAHAGLFGAAPLILDRLGPSLFRLPSFPSLPPGLQMAVVASLGGLPLSMVNNPVVLHALLRRIFRR